MEDTFSDNYSVTAIVVDDELHARQSLVYALKQFPRIEVIAQCEHGVAAVKAVHERKPMVMFLDVRMPRLDGFDVMDLLGEDAPITVFVTAHDEYAIKAFESKALDYLLKPVGMERLKKTVDRILSEAHKHSHITATQKLNASIVEQYKQAITPIQRVLVRDKSEVHVIPVAEIQFIESADDYVVIHTEGKNHIKQERLQSLEDTLDSHLFCRVHRSCLINIAFLAGIDSESKDSKVVIMKNKERLPVSRSGYQRLVKLL